MDLSYDGFKTGEWPTFGRTLSWEWRITTEQLVELAHDHTDTILANIRSFASLSSLTITLPPFRSIHQRSVALHLAHQIWSPLLETFTMKASEYFERAPYAVDFTPRDAMAPDIGAGICVTREYWNASQSTDSLKFALRRLTNAVGIPIDVVTP